MKFNKYLFDFDGVLVDSMPYWSEKMINILKVTHTSYPEDIVKIITPLGDKGTATYFQDVLKVNMAMDEMFALMDEYALPKYRDEILIKEGVFEFLRMLKEKHSSINILTASPHKMVDPCLKRLGVYEWFDHIWTCEDFQLTKSDVRIFEKAADCLGCQAADIMFFDDNITALRTAAKAGMYTVGVYDETSADMAEQVKETAKQYIYSFREMI